MILPVVEVTVGPRRSSCAIVAYGRHNPEQNILSETRIHCDILTGHYMVTTSDFLITSAGLPSQSKVCLRLRRANQHCDAAIVRLWPDLLLDSLLWGRLPGFRLWPTD